MIKSHLTHFIHTVKNSYNFKRDLVKAEWPAPCQVVFRITQANEY